MRRVLIAVALPALLAAGCTSSARPDDGGATAPATAPASSGATGSPSTAAAGSTVGPSTGPSTGPSAGSSTQAEWPTYHGTPDRAGVSTTMPAANGPLRVITRVRLDGAVYASPIVGGGRTVIATENDTVYGFDSAYRQVWKQHLGSPSPAHERECGNIDPLGITGTPVYADGLIYVAAEYGGPVRHELVALRPSDGAVQWRRSLDLPGVETRAMQERGALAVAGGRIWVPFGGLAGDCGGYKGRLVGYLAGGTGAPVAYTVPTAREAGIWTPPGPAVDAAGNLFVAVGNGASGVGDRYDHSDSVLKVDTSARLVDSFSPTTWPTDNDADLDLGSQGPALVGDWVFSAGKSGTAYVLRRSALGGIGGQVSEAKVCKSFGGTAVVGSTVYVPCTDGVRAVRIDSTGHMRVLWHADAAITGSPVVGGGRVWTLDAPNGVLYALDPSTGRSVASVHVGATSRFATPALTGADVLVPTLAGFTVVRAS